MKPFPCTLVAAFQPLVLVPSPAHQMSIDAPAQRGHHGRIEHREVVEPASQDRIHLSGDVSKVQICAPMYSTFRLIPDTLSGDTAGVKLVHAFPSALLKAFRGRNAYPQNVNDTMG
jgi:hypothetical protein